MSLLRLSLLTSCLILLISIVVACDRQKEAEGAASTPPTSLNLIFFGDKPIDMDKIIQEFYKRTSKTLNVKLNLEWDASEEYKKKVKLKLAAGEAIDAVFDASWMNLEGNVAQGYYRNLDYYFNNDEYPGLKKAFPPEFLEANKIDGHIFAIPLTNNLHDIEVVYIRKDIREQLGMDVIQSYDELKSYLQQVKQARPDMIPLALKGERGFFRLFADENKQINSRSDPNNIGGTGVPFQVVLSKDGKRVLGAVTIGDSREMYSSFPAPLNTPDYFYSFFDEFRVWNSFIQTDVLNERNPILLFESGKAAAVESTLTYWTEINQKLQTSVPAAELEVFVYRACIREMQENCIGTNYKAWNNLAIPVTSKHADETMKFMDWLFSKQDNHDLFALGIEGEHWIKGEGLTYKSTANAQRYLFPPYELTWNMKMSRTNVEVDPSISGYLKYAADSASYYKLPISGFVFNPTPVKTEIAKIQPVANQILQVFNSGLDPNWRETAIQTNKKLKELGLENIRAEVIKQIQAYLDGGGS